MNSIQRELINFIVVSNINLLFKDQGESFRISQLKEYNNVSNLEGSIFSIDFLSKVINSNENQE